MKMKTLRRWLTTACWMAAAGLLAGNALAEIITPGDYSNQLQIKFPGYTGVTPLTNFPALIQLTEGLYTFNYGDLESEDYSDLRFTDDTGTNAIPYEVEQWNLTVTTPVTPTTLSGCLLWLKADAGIQTNDVGGVTNWVDQSSSSYNAVSMATSVHPAYVSSGFNGLPVVRFSGANDNYIKFPRLTTIQTVFWVVKEDSDASSTQPRFLLGDTSNFHFHRGDNKMIWSSGNAPRMFNGITELNGRAIDGRTTLMPTQMSVLAVRTADLCTADSLSKDRTQTGRSWDGDVAEVIIYNRTLTPTEMAGIYAYLENKYGIDVVPDQTSSIWVQIPVLTNNASIYAYWGNPAATAIPDYTTNGTVWADGYVGVYHLNETGNTLAFSDSSPLNNTMASVAAPAETSGKVDHALYLKNDNANEPPRISSPAGGLTLGSVTVSLWVNTPGATSWRNWWGIEAGAGNHLRMELDAETPAGKCNIYPTNITGANSIANPSKPVEDGNWHYLAFTADTSANVAKVFVDGLPDGTNVAWSAVATATGLKIGASWGTYTSGIGNKIDEARFEKSVRSADWIKASYDNQLNPAAFAVVDLDYYYDTSTAAGLQAGNGRLSPTNALWSTIAGGSDPLKPWTDGVRAHFEVNGTSAVAVDPMSARKLFFDGTGYTLSGGSISLSEGIEASESATINSPLTLTATQTWTIATGKNLYIQSSMSNVSGLTKNGGGTVYLDGREIALKGTITINEGTLYCRGGGWYISFWQNLSPRILIVNTNGILSNDTWGMNGTAYVDSPIPDITLRGGTWRLDGGAEVRADDVIMTAGRITGAGQWRVGAGAMVVNPDTATSVIDGAGSLTLYASPSFQVANGAADPDLSITRAIGINGTGRAITKSGTGTLLMTAANSYDGGTTINAGTLLVNNTTGSGTGTGPVTINGGTLSGTGTVANVVSFGANGGTIVPGPTTGTLTVKSNITFTASGAATNVFTVTINSTTDYTRLRVAEGGTVTLDNATLNVTLNATLFNTKLFIVVNDGTDPIDGTFKDLPDGQLLLLGPNEDSYTIHYSANADTDELSGGNDVALFPVPKGTILLLR